MTAVVAEPHVHLGHVEHTLYPAPTPVAFCAFHGASCLWSEGDHVRTDGVAHAQTKCHRVIVVIGCDRTPIEVTW